MLLQMSATQYDSICMQRTDRRQRTVNSNRRKGKRKKEGSESGVACTSDGGLAAKMSPDSTNVGDGVKE